MRWKSIELDEVLAYANNDRLTAAWSANDDAQRDTWFGTTRDTVVAQIRAKCSALGLNQIDADSFRIPPEFVELAALRLLVAILGRLGPTAATGGDAGADPLGLTADQKDRLRQLGKDLDDVAAGKLSVSPTDHPLAGGFSGPAVSAVQLASSTERRFSRDTTRGL